MATCMISLPQDLTIVSMSWNICKRERDVTSLTASRADQMPDPSRQVNVLPYEIQKRLELPLLPKFLGSLGC